MICVSLYLTDANMIILAEIVHQSSCICNPKSKNLNFWPLGSQNLKIWPLDFSNFQKFLNSNFPVTLLLSVMEVSCRNSQSMSRIIVLTIPMTGRHFNSSPCNGTFFSCTLHFSWHFCPYFIQCFSYCQYLCRGSL